MDEYRKIFIEMFQLEEGFDPQRVIRGETDDWDSIGHISLIAKLEETFNILFETEDILKFRSYAGGIDLLKKYGVNLKDE